MSLVAPSRHFASAKLDTKWVDPSTLLRISRHNTDEPYFGKSGGNRFDDPRSVMESKKYGTSYFGFSLHCAFAETVLHDEIVDLKLKGFPIARSELERYVVTFAGQPARAFAQEPRWRRDAIDDSPI